MTQYKHPSDNPNRLQRFNKWLADDFIAFTILLTFTVWVTSCQPIPI